MSCFPFRLAAAVLFATAATAVSTPARAAESYDNCTGTISALPAVITAQGTWCLKGDLATTITSGEAILVDANNVTIDCNGFKVGGLSAGPATDANGIRSDANNTTVRGCAVRGFRYGIRMGGDGALVEDNRLDGNTDAAIWVYASGAVVRGNRIVDTGGRAGAGQIDGIYAGASESTIIDNTIAGVFHPDAGGDVSGIVMAAANIEVGRNFISGLMPGVGGDVRGIDARAGESSSVHDNHILSSVVLTGTGIDAQPSLLCGGNRIVRFSTGIANCTNAGGNANL